MPDAPPPRPAQSRPRVLFVSRTRYELPLGASLAAKWAALGELLDLRVLATGVPGSDVAGPFRLIAPIGRGKRSAWFFWLLLPLHVAAELRRFRPEAVIAQSPFEAAAAELGARLARRSCAVVCDVQGDWRSATRLYGSRSRLLLAALADRVAAAALRRADAVRTISPYTSALVRELGLEPAACFPTFVDVDAFTRQPVRLPPPEGRALFVGVLEPYKNIDVLAAAWRQVAAALPGAELHLVGRGSREATVRALLRDLPGRVRWTPSLDAEGVAAALDDATLLVLPSRSEGMGRVIIEAFCRARPVLGARVGGIPDLVADNRTGLLVSPTDGAALAAGLERLLGDAALAETLGVAGRTEIGAWLLSPAEFAHRTLTLLETVLETGRETPASRR